MTLIKRCLGILAGHGSALFALAVTAPAAIATLPMPNL
jgi:hypothetical protein